MSFNNRQSIETIARKDKLEGISSKFGLSNERAGTFSFHFDQLYFDFSKTHISEELLQEYLTLAEELEVTKLRNQMFSGEKINLTEQRAVLHTLLRSLDNHGIPLVDQAAITQAKDAQSGLFDVLARISAAVSQRAIAVKNIIHVGIGGSSLGTQLLFEALKDYDESVNIHFLSNIDAHQLQEILASCEYTDTIVIGVSKTFSTAETLRNIKSIGEWYSAQGGELFEDLLYAVTANEANALKYGILPKNIVNFPNWVGGRYSVWSAVSLSAAIVLGEEKFKQFLHGASLFDEHFLDSPLETNISFLAAMMDHYYVNYMGAQSRGIFAYDHRLRSLVPFIQQLETESNGKDRSRSGEEVTQRTSAVVWGGVGTDVQHSVFQMLHQGTNIIPAEFLLVVNPDHQLTEHHSELLANGVAQTAALLSGQDEAEVNEVHKADHLRPVVLKSKIFSGERPSTTVLIQSLTPQNLGSLLAYYEHRTFWFGALADINSFDQMGVELGKRLAKEIRPLIDGAETTGVNLDESTKQIVEKLRALSSTKNAK